VKFSNKVSDRPAKLVFFIPNENSFKMTRPALITKFRINGNKALTPPYLKVREGLVCSMSSYGVVFEDSTEVGANYRYKSWWAWCHPIKKQSGDSLEFLHF
jgi:hypothetical protein